MVYKTELDVVVYIIMLMYRGIFETNNCPVLCTLQVITVRKFIPVIIILETNLEV